MRMHMSYLVPEQPPANRAPAAGVVHGDVFRPLAASDDLHAVASPGRQELRSVNGLGPGLVNIDPCSVRQPSKASR